MKPLVAAGYHLALAVAAAGIFLPAGTRLEIRMLSAASSLSRPGEGVEAVLIAPVTVEDEIWLPQGTRLKGKVEAARPSSPDTRAELLICFRTLHLPDGRQLAVRSRVVEVDNAREAVTEDGTIQGILESETLVAQMDQGLDRLSGRYGRLAAVLGSLRNTIFGKPDTEIRLEAGTELSLVLEEPLPLERPFPPQGLNLVEPAGELFVLVQKLPLRTTAEKPPKPSDLTNLLLVGTREQIEKAFHAAGWSTAEELNARSGLETARAIAELRGYKEAPMSVLLLEGKPPDLVFQKQYNTFAKRHHLRIYQRPEKFQGRQVWVVAATHDIGIAFSPENRTFIHLIDPEIDRERAKVAFDLIFTGCVESLALVDRPHAPRETENATGDKIRTDGRIAVLVLR